MLGLPMVIWEQEKFVTFFQLLKPLSFLGSPAASVSVCNAQERQLHGQQYHATVHRHKDQHLKQGGVTSGSAQGSVQGQARGAGENCSAGSPKGWCAIKNTVQQPGEHCKGKHKCDLTKPRISIYLDGLQSVTKFRLIATLVRNHHYCLVYILVFFQLFHPSIPFNLGN